MPLFFIFCFFLFYNILTSLKQIAKPLGQRHSCPCNVKGAQKKFRKNSGDRCIGFTQSKHQNYEAIIQEECTLSSYLHNKVLQVVVSYLVLVPGYMKIRIESVEHD